MDPHTPDPALIPVLVMVGQLIAKYVTTLWAQATANFNLQTFLLSCAQLAFCVTVTVSQYIYVNFNLKALVTSSWQMLVVVTSGVWDFLVTNVNLKTMARRRMKEVYKWFLGSWTHVQNQLNRSNWSFWEVLQLSNTKKESDEEDEKNKEEEEKDGEKEEEQESEEDYEDPQVLEHKAMTDKVMAVEEAIRNRHATVVAAADLYRDHALSTLELFQQQHQRQLHHHQLKDESQLQSLRSSSSGSVLDVMARMTSFASSSSGDAPTLSSSASTTVLDLLSRVTSWERGSRREKTELRQDLKNLSMLSSMLNGFRIARSSSTADGDVTFSGKGFQDQANDPNSDNNGVSTIQRPVLRYNTDISAILDTVRNFLGAVETMEMTDVGFRDEVEEMFRCGEEGEEEGGEGVKGTDVVEIRALQILPNNTVHVRYTMRGLGELDSRSEFRDKLGQRLSMDNSSRSSLGKIWETVTKQRRHNISFTSAGTPSMATRRLTPIDKSVSSSRGSSSEKTFSAIQAKRRSFTGEAVWLKPDASQGGGTILKGEDPERGSCSTLFHILQGFHRAVDVDFREELFVVVEEEQQSEKASTVTSKRTVKLYRPPSSDETWTSALARTVSSGDWRRGLRAGELMATYVPPASEFQPSDICFFPLQIPRSTEHRPNKFSSCSGVLMIADEINDAIHLVQIVSADDCRHSSPSSLSSSPPMSTSSTSSCARFSRNTKENKQSSLSSSSSYHRLPPYSASSSSASSFSSKIYELRFVRYLAAGHPLLVQPTALGVDLSAQRLWVACRGGAVLSIRPDLEDLTS